jgi:predicted nuclease with TOPRIM domain
MSNLSEIVDSLENRISKLLHKYESLRQTNSKLEEELTLKKQEHSKSLGELKQWREQTDNLKVANAMLGSDQFKRETKLKINSLIREIDVCISQLND